MTCKDCPTWYQPKAWACPGCPFNPNKKEKENQNEKEN